MKTMTDDPQPFPGSIDRGMTSWRNVMLASAVGGIVSLLVAVAIAFGGRVVTGGETSAVLTTNVQSLLEDNKEQRKQLTEIILKLGAVYTREEARQDREAAERRFQSMEGRLSDLTRRLDTLEQRSLMIERGKR